VALVAFGTGVGRFSVAEAAQIEPDAVSSGGRSVARSVAADQAATGFASAGAVAALRAHIP
jgi:hypothetical protein